MDTLYGDITCTFVTECNGIEETVIASASKDVLDSLVPEPLPEGTGWPIVRLAKPLPWAQIPDAQDDEEELNGEASHVSGQEDSEIE